MLSKLRKMRNIDEDDETVAADASDAQPAWLKSLAANCSTWLKLLPEVGSRFDIEIHADVCRIFQTHHSPVKIPCRDSLLANCRLAQACSSKFAKIWKLYFMLPTAL